MLEHVSNGDKVEQDVRGIILEHALPNIRIRIVSWGSRDRIGSEINSPTTPAVFAEDAKLGATAASDIQCAAPTGRHRNPVRVAVTQTVWRNRQLSQHRLQCASFSHCDVI